MHRLQDMIEQKTDVRAKGMQGFYSNLLTKNVAMGGSMDNAVSIYTSGSKRQAHQLEGQEEVPEKETKPAQTEEEAAAVVNKDQVASSSTVKATEEVNPTPDTSNSEPTPDDALARSKPSTLSAAEKVALAKQRYLERKQK